MRDWVNHSNGLPNVLYIRTCTVSGEMITGLNNCVFAILKTILVEKLWIVA